jgi:peptide deformylase
MIVPIVQYGDPILRQKGKPVATITPEIEQLVRDMVDTMHEANGVGLAAQQIGRALQLAVIDIPADTERPSRMWKDGREVPYADFMPLVLINPEISMTKKKECGSEGCLSFPGLQADISRSARVKVSCQLLDGKSFAFEADGLLGRAVQHEFDHLQGILFIDRMAETDRRELKASIEALKSTPGQPA